MQKVSHPFHNITNTWIFCLVGHRTKDFLDGDFSRWNLDLLPGHQGLSACYPGVKDNAEGVHLQEQGCVLSTPETCQLLLRTGDEILEHYVANAVDDRMDGSEQVKTTQNHFK